MSHWYDEVNHEFYFETHLSDEEECEFSAFWTYCDVLAAHMSAICEDNPKFEDLPDWNRQIVIAYATSTWNVRRARMIGDLFNEARDTERNVAYWREKVEPLKAELAKLKRREASRKRAKAKKAANTKKRKAVKHAD